MSWKEKYSISPKMSKLYGCPILRPLDSGWCVPSPLWCAENLRNHQIFEWHRVLTHKKLLPYIETFPWEDFFPAGKGFVEVYSWSPRLKNLRRGNELSKHAYGLALDINWTENPLGGLCHSFPEGFSEAMEVHGFIWGGRWKMKDWHHFELSDEVDNDAPL